MTTTSIAQGTARPAILRPAVQRFTASIAALGEVVLDAIEAARAIETANTPDARRVVLDRFASRSAGRAA
jgi:hypothetical protein